jgi:F-type H+-transporting ATPase subunit gamma
MFIQLQNIHYFSILDKDYFCNKLMNKHIGIFMAQLIQMRQRINVIETIKKITHAMRLVSMSMHSHLKHHEQTYADYYKHLENLFYTTKHAAPNWKHPIFAPEKPSSHRSLAIIIGSQKGLCGNFNSSLFSLFEKHEKKNQNSFCDIIVIGGKAVTHFQHNKLHKTIALYPRLSKTNIFMLGKNIVQNITNNHISYKHVTIYGNKLRTFFLQQPYKQQLLPFDEHNLNPPKKRVPNKANHEHLWEEPIEKIIDKLSLQYIEGKLQHALFLSLIAEQAARFLSMDNATRNAHKLLETTRLQYNKIRQAKITKEINELSGAF